MKILVADDDYVSRLRLERLLNEWGHEVVAVKDGNEAWEVLQGPTPLTLAILEKLKARCENHRTKLFASRTGAIPRLLGP